VIEVILVLVVVFVTLLFMNVPIAVAIARTRILSRQDAHLHMSYDEMARHEARAQGQRGKGAW